MVTRPANSSGSALRARSPGAPSRRARGRDRPRAARKACARSPDRDSARAPAGTPPPRDPAPPAFPSQVLRHHMMDSAQTRPRRRIARIVLHASQVQVAREAPLLRIVTELIAAQKILVRGLLDGTSFRASAVREASAAAKATMIRWTAVLNPKQVADRRLRRVDHSSVPVEASVSWVVTRISSPAKQRAGHDHVDVGLRADFSRVLASPANRAAAMLDRTTSDSSPDSELVSASGRLKARKSVSGSGRSMRNGSTIRRVRRRAARVDRFDRHRGTGSRGAAGSR